MFKPRSSGFQCDGFSHQLTDEMVNQIGRRIRFLTRELCQREQELIGIATRGIDQPTGPQVSSLVLVLTFVDFNRSFAQGFDQCHSQHEWHRPEFGNRQGGDLLVRGQKVDDVLLIHLGVS